MGTYIFACTWKDSMFDIHKLHHLIKYSIKQPAKDLQKNYSFHVYYSHFALAQRHIVSFFNQPLSLMLINDSNAELTLAL